LFLSSFAFSDSLGDEKARAKQILKIVSKDIEKNYYDPNLKGLNWAELNSQAVEIIDNAKSVGQIYTTIFGLVDRLNDSHTMFLSPGRVSVPQFGFEAKAFGNEIYVTKIKISISEAISEEERMRCPHLPAISFLNPTIWPMSLPEREPNREK
jgi:hypothetical protein